MCRLNASFHVLLWYQMRASCVSESTCAGVKCELFVSAKCELSAYTCVKCELFVFAKYELSVYTGVKCELFVSAKCELSVCTGVKMRALCVCSCQNASLCGALTGNANFLCVKMRALCGALTGNASFVCAGVKMRAFMHWHQIQALYDQKLIILTSFRNYHVLSITGILNGIASVITTQKSLN